MGLRFHKEIKLGEGVKININKKSASLSVGLPGLHFTIGPRGPMINVDLPGGLSYRKTLGKSRKETNREVQLSLADLYMQQRYDDIFNLFSQSTPELKAEDDASVEIMYYWAIALTAKGLYDAADLVYKRALARKKGINPDLRLMLRYGRADLYERRSKPLLARKHFEQLFAEAPVFLDVPQRIAALNEK